MTTGAEGRMTNEEIARGIAEFHHRGDCSCETDNKAIKCIVCQLTEDIKEVLDAKDQTLLKVEAELKTQIAEFEAKLKTAREALEKARPYVEEVWNATKGTEREGTAMGSADTLLKIEAALNTIKGQEGEG